MDIEINETELRKNAVTADDGGFLPTIVMQYDPPWDLASKKDHFHYMPTMAVGDIQLTYGIEADEEAVEFGILDHAADVQLSMTDPVRHRQYQAEKNLEIRSTLQVVGEFLIAEARAMPLKAQAEAKEELFELTKPTGGGFGKRGLKGSSRMGELASSIQFVQERSKSAAMERAQAQNGLKKSGKGYVQLVDVLGNEAELMEESRRRVHDMKYGHAIQLILGEKTVKLNPK